MAFAIASGVGPERGLYTAVIAGFLISALGGSRVQIGGPTGAFVVIVAGIIVKFGYDGLAATTLIAGGILIAMGLFRLGGLIRFIPYPLITGFTSGIAVIIFSSQIKDFFGLQMGLPPADFIEKWRAYLNAFPTANFWPLAIGIFTVLCITLWPKRWRKVPGPVAALVIASSAAAIFKLPVETIHTRFGSIPRGIPHPSIPALSWDLFRQVFPSAVTVALLAAVESLLSAVVADGMIGGRHKSNMELIAQGAANLVSPLFGGIPATGAIARTATNVKNGGRTPVAGIVHALVLLSILVAAGDLAARVPLACLAGILIVVSYHMSEWRSFRSMLTTPRGDVAVMLITFILTVLIDLTVAVEVGMVLAAFLFMSKMADLTQVRNMKKDMQDPENGEGDIPPELRNLQVPNEIEIYSIHGSFSFGAANQLLELIRITAKPPKVLVLEMSDVLYMDATGLHVLDEMRKQCVNAGIRFIISGIHMQPLTVLERSGKFQEFGENNLKENLAGILKELANPARTPASGG